MNGASWQARTAVALLIGAARRGRLRAARAMTSPAAFVLATIVVAIALGWRFGPSVGGVGAGFPPIGVAFVDSGGDTSARASRPRSPSSCCWAAPPGSPDACASATGTPPWGHSAGVSE